MRTLLLMAALAALCAPAAWAGKAHDHGVARLDVAVEPGRVVLELDTPLDNLLGFERAPRTDAERDKAKAVIARLRDAGTLFRIDSQAGCTPGKVQLNAPVLGEGQPEPGAKEGHADLEGSFEFNCKAGNKAGFVEVGLFEAFPGLKRIELQVVTPKGQLKATLQRPASRVVLVR
jgi:hypothetical protein